MVNQRRGGDRRRDIDRRNGTAGASLDVTRLEHENLYNQVLENVRALRRMESELAVICSLLERSMQLRGNPLPLHSLPSGNAAGLDMTSPVVLKREP